ncbi:hypothetical protein ACFLZQ_05275 [Thermodesulfobacteriota bacterium]
MYIPNRHFIDLEQRKAVNGDPLEKTYYRAKVGLTSPEKIRQAYASSTLNALGIKTPSTPRAENLPANMRMWEFHKKIMLARGEKPGFPDQIAERALSSSDFGYALDDVLSKSLELGFSEAQAVHTKFTGKRFVTNYLPHHADIIEAETPTVVNNEYEFGKFSDTGETVTVKPRGMIYALTAKTIREKTLADMALVIKGAGQAMLRYEGDLVTSVLTSGTTTMGDGNALFHAASHNNYVTSGGAPSETTLGVAINAMMDQKLLTDRTKSAGIIPRYLLVPPALQSTAESVLKVMRDDYTQNPIIVLVDHRLGDTNDSGWYLLSEGAVSLFYLEEADKPRIEIQPSWTTSSLEVKAAHDFTAATIDWRKCFYNDGVT